MPLYTGGLRCISDSTVAYVSDTLRVYDFYNNNMVSEVLINTDREDYYGSINKLAAFSYTNNSVIYDKQQVSNASIPKEYYRYNFNTSSEEKLSIPSSSSYQIRQMTYTSNHLICEVSLFDTIGVSNYQCALRARGQITARNLLTGEERQIKLPGVK